MIDLTKRYSQYFEVAIFLRDKKLANLLASYLAYTNRCVVLDVRGSYNPDPENEKLILDKLEKDIEKNLSFPLKRSIYNILRKILCRSKN
jgi:hypothetical protein